MYLGVGTNAPLGHRYSQDRKHDHEVARVFFAVEVRYESGQKIWGRVVQRLQCLAGSMSVFEYARVDGTMSIFCHQSVYES